MIRLSDIHKSFGSHEVLKGVNLDVKEGEKLVIIGPSGSGKSTTVRCMNGLETPTSGHVYIDDKELTKQNRISLVRSTSSMVFQQFNLYPHLTVMGNLTLAPIKLFGKTKKEAQDLARHYLSVVGLEEKANAYPATLSGGQQQRVAIARALCSQTKIILFDEPTSALDPELVGEVLTVIRDLAAHGMPMIMVTHQMEFARAVATEILFMEAGRVIEQGSPEKLLAPGAQTRTQDFCTRLFELCGETPPAQEA